MVLSSRSHCRDLLQNRARVPMRRGFLESFAALPQCICKIRFHPLQLVDLAPDDTQLLRDQVAHMLAYFLRMPLNREQLADFAEREPELLRLLNKLQVGDLSLPIKPIAAWCP